MEPISPPPGWKNAIPGGERMIIRAPAGRSRGKIFPADVVVDGSSKREFGSKTVCLFFEISRDELLDGLNEGRLVVEVDLLTDRLPPYGCRVVLKEDLGGDTRAVR